MNDYTRHWYSPIEFADRFNISLSYVYLLIQRGEMKAVKLGKVYRIPRKEYCARCSGMNGCEMCEWRK